MPAVNANLVRLGEAEAVGGTIRTSACDKRAGQELTSYRLQTQSSFNFTYRMGFTGGSAGKESACNVGDLGSIPGLGRSPGEGKGYPLQYSGLENSMDSIVNGVAKSRTQLSNFHSLTEHQFKDKVLEDVQIVIDAAKQLQSWLTLCDPIDGSPPGSPVPGILQARTPEWVAISVSNA